MYDILVIYYFINGVITLKEKSIYLTVIVDTNII